MLSEVVVDPLIQLLERFTKWSLVIVVFRLGLQLRFGLEAENVVGNSLLDIRALTVPFEGPNVANDSPGVGALVVD